MKNKYLVIKKQRQFIAELKNEAHAYVAGIDKTELETVLLSGSVARGDFLPGKYGGMIDLTVMRKVGSAVAAADLFGADEDEYIPYHCVKRGGQWYSIGFHDFITADAFSGFAEEKKFALLESEILWEAEERYRSELEIIARLSKADQRAKFGESLGYIHYLLSDYKKDRWQRRGAYLQMQENLSTAIRAAVNCLFYLNGYYAPAEDRSLYYSLSLENLPEDYENMLYKLSAYAADSEENYGKREELFNRKFLGYIADRKN